MKHAILALSAGVFLSMNAPVFAQNSNDDAAMNAAIKALDAQLPGRLINNPFLIDWRTDGPDNVEKIVEAPDIPGGYAYQVRVKKTKPNPWDIATRIPMTEDINKGDKILVSVWIRAAKPKMKSDTGDVTIALQRNVEPYDSIFEKELSPTEEWALVTVGGTANLDYPASKTQLNFNLARARQTIEYGQFYIMNLGPDANLEDHLTD